MIPNTLTWQAATPIQSEWSWLRSRDFDKLQQRWVQDHYARLSFQLECVIAADSLTPKCTLRPPFSPKVLSKRKRSLDDDSDYEEGLSSAEHLNQMIGPSKPPREEQAEKKGRKILVMKRGDRMRVAAGMIEKPRYVKRKKV